MIATNKQASVASALGGVLGPLGCLVLLCGIALAPAAALGQASGSATSAAHALMKRGLYQDAIRVLTDAVKHTPEAKAGKEFLMLGESYYALKRYGDARPWFAKARTRAVDVDGKTLAEYRLACIAYRLGDAAGARKQTDAFLKAHPSDRRSGILLIFRMKRLARRGRDVEPQMEAIYKQISAKGAGYGSAASLAASKVLTDFYLRHGLEEKAKQRYAGIVYGFRDVIIQYALQRRRVPKSFEQAHDHAAMQLGVINLKTKRWIKASRWLEHVRYDPQLKREARLLLAQVAYRRRDFNRAIGYLTDQGFLDSVPQGRLRSDMCLLLGLCEKSKPKPNLSKVEIYLKQVGRNSKGYFQAQVSLADLYRDRKVTNQAIRAYENAAGFGKYEAHSLYHAGQLYMAAAQEQADPVKRKGLFDKAAAKFSKLATRHPASAFVSRASKSIDILLGKGIKVSVATTDEDKARQWLAVARQRRGTAVGARAAIGLARLHHNTVMDEKGTKFIKAPDYVRCAAACEDLLDAKAYTGEGFTPQHWKALRVEAIYYRAVSHLASFAPPKAPAGPIRPRYLRSASLDVAIRDFSQAKKLVDPRRLDMVKSIELGLLEAMFKSDNPDHQSAAEARFAKLADEYGTDVRFQKLAMDLAEWYRQQGRFADAAREYKGIADRGVNLPREDLLRSLFLAGKLYSQAAFEARDKAGQRLFGIYIHPKAVFKTPDLLQAHLPLRKKIRVHWPAKAKEITGEVAIGLVSKAAGVPFVWAPAPVAGSVAQHLKAKRIRFKSLNGTVKEFLAEILDLDKHRFVFDIGMTGGRPTFIPPPRDLEDPDAPEPVKIIEIYAVDRVDKRFRPLNGNYGSFAAVHRKGPAMLFHVIARVEAMSKTKILWAEGVEKEDALAAEFTQVPSLKVNKSSSVAVALARFLEKLDLRYTIVVRDQSTEWYDKAKDCFNEIRKIEPKSTFGERSLFILALNFFRQQDYQRMKIVLREYLKLFDDPSNEHYHEACFWVGWVFEHENRYRDACHWYNRAAEESLLVFKPDKNAPRLSREQLKDLLSYDTAFALEELVGGEFKNYTLENEFAQFLQLNANVSMAVDATATGIDTPIHRAPFARVPVYTVLCETLEELGLSFRASNVNAKVAEKSYYRLAAAYKKDALMPQALTACKVLLDRFPDTRRKRDAYKLKLEIYKGLKDYRNVLATLHELKTELGEALDAYKIDFELAWIYLDLCRYKDAVSSFEVSLARVKDAREDLKIRDGYARALFRSGNLKEALAQYRTLARDESQPVIAFVHRTMVWYLERATGAVVGTELWPEAAALMKAYTNISDKKRAKLSANTLGKVTWVYYVTGLLDLKGGRTEDALEKLGAAGNSPDDWLAADALYRCAIVHRATKNYHKTKEALEYMLFATRSAEAEVKATYALGHCLLVLKQPRNAKTRFERLIKRYPDSAYEAMAHYGLGQCFQQLGEQEKAKEQFDLVLERFPNSSGAKQIRQQRLKDANPA